MTSPITFKVTSAGVAPVNVSGATLDEISRALPEGTYTTMRT